MESAFGDLSLSVTGHDVDSSFEYFVLQMLGQVIVLEEHRYCCLSGMRLFVRVDASVYRNMETGQNSFFINEMTRSTTTSLFKAFQDKDEFKVLIRTFADTLHVVASQKCTLRQPPRHEQLQRR